jgi:hypothetical protein
MLRFLTTTVSYAAMTILSMHYAEEDQRKSQAFMDYVEASRKHRLRITFRGKPFLPVFHAGHRIKPDNWAEAPLVQS